MHLVHNAYMEKNAAFRAAWTDRPKDLQQLQNSGVAALGVSFCEAEDPRQLRTFRDKVPESAHQTFEELLKKRSPGKQEVICATWYSGYVLRHGDSEIDQCEYWISSTHPGTDHFTSVWPAWPPRKKGGQSLTPSACAFLWDVSQNGPFLCADKGRPDKGPEGYRCDRVPDDSQLSAIRKVVYTFYSQYMSADDRAGMSVPVLLALAAPGLMYNHIELNKAQGHIDAAKGAARIASHLLQEPVRNPYQTVPTPIE